MIRDFDTSPADDLPRHCDVAVVGAGVAGTILACELARAGQRVVLLESGDRRQPQDTHPLNRVEQGGSFYAGAEHGRFRCLGGTSTRWGGALLPFLREDLGAGWPVAFDELITHLPRAEHLFRLPAGDYCARDVETALSIDSRSGFRARAAKWPTFARRNVAALLGADLEGRQGPHVWLNATVTALEIGADGRVTEVAVRSLRRAAKLRAGTVVLAAGALECTRLLLHLDARQGGRLADRLPALGRYFHDHLSAPVAHIAAPRIRALRELTGFRFATSGMRNVRFELNRTRVPSLPGAFAHVVAQGAAPGGFDALRAIYRAAQRRSLPRVGDVARLARHGGWFARAAWTRMVRRRVLAPDDARYEIHMVAEQIPARENRILLSARERDCFGLPLARIEWRVRATDVDNTASLLESLQAFWSGQPRRTLGELVARSREDWAGDLERGGGIHHPGGTVRMAASPDDGVVDRDLRVFGVPNLRVLSTATFPTGGTANPTLMLVLFALRLGDDLAGR